MGPVLCYWIMLAFIGFIQNTASVSGYCKSLGMWICYDKTDMCSTHNTCTQWHQYCYCRQENMVIVYQFVNSKDTVQKKGFSTNI